MCSFKKKKKKTTRAVRFCNLAKCYNYTNFQLKHITLIHLCNFPVKKIIGATMIRLCSLIFAKNPQKIYIYIYKMSLQNKIMTMEPLRHHKLCVLIKGAGYKKR